MKRRFQAVKGTRDILPPDSALWNRVEQTARDVFRAYNFHEIRLPILEEKDLFERSIGTDTEIVAKEMYFATGRTQQYFEESRARLVPVMKRAFPDNERMSNLVLSLEILFEFMRQAYLEDEIPRTKENEDHLKALSENIHRWSQPFQNEHEWLSYCSKIEEHLEPLEFGEQQVLRPEATASVVRAYIEHGMHTQPGLARLYYIGPMFRRERPQKGRFRQFYQIGAEVLGGSDAPAIDAEVIELVMVFIEKCGLKSCALTINSIGCATCRPKYVARLRDALEEVREKLGPDSQRRIDTNPLRVLDSKVEGEQPVIEKLPSILDHLCEACRAHFAAVQEGLKERGIAFTINHRLVRGLHYYMRTTFEVTAPGLGAQNAVCGGGRYDGLSELLGGPPTKGIGWALGTDRLLLALEAAGAQAEEKLDCFIVWLGSGRAPARALARRLRDHGATVELAYEEMKLGKALERADRLGARFAVIVGDDEVARKKFTLRDLAAASQRSLAEAELMQQIIGTTDKHR